MAHRFAFDSFCCKILEMFEINRCQARRQEDCPFFITFVAVAFITQFLLVCAKAFKTLVNCYSQRVFIAQGCFHSQTQQRHPGSYPLEKRISVALIELGAN